MASVTFSPGAADVSNNFISWQDRDPPVGLVDASILSSDTDPRYCQRVRLWRSIRNDKIYINFKRTVPDGTSAFDSGDDLNDDWLVYSSALTITAPNGTLVCAGPSAATNASQDTGEVYGWVTDATEINTWATAYAALPDTDKADVTIKLDDGASSAPLDAAGALTGALAGSIAGAASLSGLKPLDAAGTLTGGLAGSLDGAASLGPINPLNSAGALTGGLAGSIAGDASLSSLPLDAAGTLDGGLAGSIGGDANLYTPPSPPSAMRQWLVALLLPWDLLGGRWATALAVAEIHQGLVDAGYEAASEWSPATCRDATLPEWARILTVPRRSGETTPAWRRRIVHWRDEPVGTSGWVRDEVQRATGDDPPRVIEFPRDALRIGYSRVGSARISHGGPSLTVGVEPADRTAVEAVLEAGVPPDVGINYVTPNVFDDI